MFFGTAGTGTRGGWGADAVLQTCHKVVETPNSGKPTDRLPGKVVTVHELRTSRRHGAALGINLAQRPLSFTMQNNKQGHPTSTVFGARMGFALSRWLFGNLPFDVSEEMLQEVFAAVGPIKSIRFPRDPAGKPKGFGFCEFYDPFAAESAVRNLNGHEVSGRQLRVSYAEENFQKDPEARREERPNPRERRTVERGMQQGTGVTGPNLPCPADRHPSGPMGPPPGKPVGVAMTSAVAATMSSWLGAPQAPGPAQTHVNNVLGGMSALQLFELMSQMRALIQQNPAQARQTLITNPQLTKALFQAQILLGMVQPPPAQQAAPQPVPAPAVAQQLPGHGQPTVILSAPNMAFAGLLPGYHGPPAIVQVAQPAADLQNRQVYAIQASAPQPQPHLALAPQPVMQPTSMQHMMAPAVQPAVQPVMQPAPAPAPAAALPTDQQALLAQVISMTPEQIDALPEVTRQQVLQVKQLLMSQAVQ
ncbi:hypothetical protein QJQ45_019546 [Haematococcus lacustris]|nr:hypothetical protein QJQ45_019546 [Haematococcus lacustris]